MTSGVRYELHFGVELPFWIALADGTYELVLHGNRHRINLSNDIARLEIGDFHLGQGAIGSQWVPRGAAEQARQILTERHPGMPITRHDAKTVITHVREIEAPDRTAVESYYTVSRVRLYEETLGVFNKFIQAYMIAAHETGQLGQAGAIDAWDLAGILVSFWEFELGTTAAVPRQFGGTFQRVRPEMPAPAPLDGSAISRIESLLITDEALPLIDSLHSGAAAKIERGDYRGAVLDDITAIDLKIEASFRTLLPSDLPESMVNALVRTRFTELPRWTGSLGGHDLSKDTRVWERVNRARETRHRLTHRGETLERAEAAEIHNEIAEALGVFDGSRQPEE